MITLFLFLNLIFHKVVFMNSSIQCSIYFQTIPWLPVDLSITSFHSENIFHLYSKKIQIHFSFYGKTFPFKTETFHKSKKLTCDFNHKTFDHVSQLIFNFDEFLLPFFNFFSPKYFLQIHYEKKI